MHKLRALWYCEDIPAVKHGGGACMAAVLAIIKVFVFLSWPRKLGAFSSPQNSVSLAGLKNEHLGFSVHEGNENHVLHVLLRYLCSEFRK